MHDTLHKLVTRHIPQLEAFMATFRHYQSTCTETAILGDIYWAGLLLPEIIIILFTQSAVVFSTVISYLPDG